MEYNTIFTNLGPARVIFPAACCGKILFSKRRLVIILLNRIAYFPLSGPRMLIRAKNAGTMCHETAVKIILQNRHYTGDLVQGRSSVDRDNKLFHQEKGYKLCHQMDESKWFVVENAHFPIISGEEFAAVQEKVAFKSRAMFCGRGKESLFARLAYCAHCGKGMII